METIGLDWRLADAYVDNLRAVTPEQIREVAKRYLIDDNLSTAILEPLPIEGKMTRQATGGGRHGA